jgi:hypothetical protein
MRIAFRVAFPALAALGSFGCTEEPVVEQNPPEAAPIDTAVIAQRSLDSLESGEAAAVCLEDLRRSDLCLEYGVTITTSERDCNAAVATCRAELVDERATSVCPALELGPEGTCTVTVERYLACVDAWTHALTCADAGYSFTPPEPCQSVIAGCERFADQFTIHGKPRPCTAEESRDKPPHTGADVVGEDGCRPTPARFVVLGDSIAECTGVAPEDCAPFLIAEHLRKAVSPDLVFESKARPGARVADLLAQAEGVAPGPGHVFVFIYALGGDLLAGFFDSEALIAGFRSVFDYFNAESAFPDGVTFLLNTQYTNNDECYVPGAQNSAGQAAYLLIPETNRRVILDVAASRSDALAIDQYPDFLGHGMNANITGCPHCGLDNSHWIEDGLHPNELGHAHIAEKWIAALDKITGAACAPAPDG